MEQKRMQTSAHDEQQRRAFRILENLPARFSYLTSGGRGALYALSGLVSVGGPSGLLLFASTMAGPWKLKNSGGDLLILSSRSSFLNLLTGFHNSIATVRPRSRSNVTKQPTVLWRVSIRRPPG